MNKNDRKYLKTALRMLRQGNSMLTKFSERCELNDVSKITANIHNSIENSLKSSELLKDYLTGQYSLNFNEETN